VAGRLWCGYACPQTVYTEIFMWIERKVEGDRSARMKLDAGRFVDRQSWARSGSSTRCGSLFALWTGFTFVGYFTPIRDAGGLSLAGSLGPWQTFWVLFYGFATYGNAGFMREQVCKYMCPYARFQSAMFDKDTLIVTYDDRSAASRAARAVQARPTEGAWAWAPASTARCACRSARPASTSARACSTSASAAPPASTCATR
jgi:polyferredoxin